MSAHKHAHADGVAGDGILDTATPPSSPYPMLDVATALSHILSSISPLPSMSLPTLSPSLPGCILTSPIHSPSDFPPFPASFMDGYAVVAPCPPGVYPITQRCTAGHLSTTPLLPSQAAYITTGSPLPPNANSVCIVEHSIPLPTNPPTVRLLSHTPPHQHVRPIGSDARKGQLPPARRHPPARGRAGAAGLPLHTHVAHSPPSPHRPAVHRRRARRPLLLVLLSLPTLPPARLHSGQQPSDAAHAARSADTRRSHRPRYSPGHSSRSTVRPLPVHPRTAGRSRDDRRRLDGRAGRVQRVPRSPCGGEVRKGGDEAGQTRHLRAAAQGGKWGRRGEGGGGGGGRGEGGGVGVAGQPCERMGVLSPVRGARCEADGGAGGRVGRPRVRAVQGEVCGAAEAGRGESGVPPRDRRLGWQAGGAHRAVHRAADVIPPAVRRALQRAAHHRPGREAGGRRRARRRAARRSPRAHRASHAVTARAGGQACADV